MCTLARVDVDYVQSCASNRISVQVQSGAAYHSKVHVSPRPSVIPKDCSARHFGLQTHAEQSIWPQQICVHLEWSMAGAQKSSVLYSENDKALLASQSEMLQKAGYAVTQALGRAAAEQALKQGSFNLMVLGHTLSKEDRHHLPYKARKANEDMRILVLHASGKHPAVDMAIDSRGGAEVVLRAISSVLAMKTAGAAAR